MPKLKQLSRQQQLAFRLEGNVMSIVKKTKKTAHFLQLYQKLFMEESSADAHDDNRTGGQQEVSCCFKIKVLIVEL